MKIDVMTKYQVAATSSRGMGSKSAAEISVARPKISWVYGIATTSEEVLSSEMNSLPVGGMMMRIACGITVRRMVIHQPKPKALDASSWPSGTEEIPERTISAMYAASLRPKLTTARKNADESTPSSEISAKPRLMD